MIIYILNKSELSARETASLHIDGEKIISFPFDPANTDYANFKKQINADEAQLQDADGNTMTAEDAKAYVATLP